MVFFSKPFEVEFIFLLHSGFPPGDYGVRRFLVHAPFTPNDASTRARAFLISLFETTATIIPCLDNKLRDIISKLPPADRPTSNAQKFRLFMTAGQSYTRHGAQRKTFYSDVIRRAKEVSTFDLFFWAKS
jgi:hypothetical protein